MKYPAEALTKYLGEKAVELMKRTHSDFTVIITDSAGATCVGMGSGENVDVDAIKKALYNIADKIGGVPRDGEIHDATAKKH